MVSQSRHATLISDIFALKPNIPFKLNCEIDADYFIKEGNMGIFNGGDKGANPPADQS